MTDIKRFFVFSIFALVFATLSAEPFTVVIDAGHGGKDIGAVGRKIYEKNINLAVALKLGDMIKDKMKDVKVVYTRKTDKYLTLQERADIANKAKGNLFISIHTNSVAKRNKNRKTIKGASSYTLGLHRSDDNLEVAKRENSVIALEKDYTVTYQGFDPNSTESYIIFEISQNVHMEQSVNFASLVQKEFVSTAQRVDRGVRQAGFLVLARTSMPAVLVELDFICNPTQEAFLGSKSGQNKLAKALFNAFYEYKTASDNKIAAVANSNKKVENKKQEEEVAESENDTESAATQQKSERKSVEASESGDVAVDSKRYRFSTQRGKKSTSVKMEVSEKKNVKVEDKSKKKVEKSKGDKNSNNDEIVYKVQFLTSMEKLSKKDYRFKGLNPVSSYKDDGLYKYTYGSTSNLEEAQAILKKVKEKFKGAFIVHFSDGKRIK